MGGPPPDHCPMSISPPCPWEPSAKASPHRSQKGYFFSSLCLLSFLKQPLPGSLGEGGTCFPSLVQKTCTRCTSSCSIRAHPSSLICLPRGRVSRSSPIPFLGRPAPPAGLGGDGPLPEKHGFSNVAEPPRLVLCHSGSISVERHPVSRIPMSREAAFCPMEHSVAVHWEPGLFCSFH